MSDSPGPPRRGANLPSLGTYSGLVAGWVAAALLTLMDLDMPPYALLGCVVVGGVIGFSIGLLLRRALYAPRRNESQ